MMCGKSISCSKAIRMACNAPSMKLSSILLPVNPARQKELLYAIAKEGKAEKITSGAFIKKHVLLSASSVQAAMKKLLVLDLITLGNGCYTIPDHFLALYLRKLMGMDDCV